MSVYVFAGSTLVVCTPTERGWRTRSTRRDVLHHDYVSGESFDKVASWLRLQLTRIDPVCDRQEALERLATQPPWEQQHLCFLAPDPELAPPEAAERVLRHLECGW